MTMTLSLLRAPFAVILSEAKNLAVHSQKGEMLRSP